MINYKATLLLIIIGGACNHVDAREQRPARFVVNDNVNDDSVNDDSVNDEILTTSHDNVTTFSGAHSVTDETATDSQNNHGLTVGELLESFPDAAWDPGA